MSIARGLRSIVFGANGYLGRNLVRFLGDAELQMFDVQRAMMVPDSGCVPLDVTDPEQLRGVDWNVDLVYLFSGLTGTASSFESYRDFVNVNELGLLGVLDAIKRSGHRPRIVFPSTRLVYKGSEEPLAEDAPKCPKTVYAVNKLACESMLHAYSSTFQLPFTVFRICVPYGSMVSGEYSYGTIGGFLRQARQSGVIRLYGDGLLRRTFTHVEDVCSQIVSTSLDDRTRNEILNIGGETFTLRDVALAIAEKCAARIEFTTWPEQDYRMESGDTVFDATRLDSIYGQSRKHCFGAWLGSWS